MPACLKYLLLFIFTCFPYMILAQRSGRSKHHSIKIIAVKLRGDTSKVNLLIKLSENYLNGNDVQQGKSYGQKALELAKKIKWNKGLAKSYFMLGRAAYTEKDYSTAIDYQKRSVQMFKEFHDIYDEAAAEFHLAQTYVLSGTNGVAIQAYTQSIQILSQKNQSALLVDALIRAGQLYQQANNYEKAIDCYLEAKRIGDQTNSDQSKELCCFYLSEMYSGLHEYDKSLIFALDAWKYFGQQNLTNAKDRELNLLDRMVIAYTFVGDYHNALKYGNAALIIAKQLDRPSTLTRLKTNMAWDLFSLGEYAAAYPLAKEVADSDVPETTKLNNFNTLGSILRDAPDTLLEKLGIKPQEKYGKAVEYFKRSLKNRNQSSDAYSHLDLSITYERMNNLAEAYKSFKHYVALRDSSNKEEIQKILLKKEIQVDFSKKEDSLKFTQQITEEKLKQQNLLTSQQQQSLQLNSQKLSLATKQKDIERLNYLRSQANLRADDNWRKANLQKLKTTQKEKALAQAKICLQEAEIQSKRYLDYYYLAGLIILLLLGCFIAQNYYNQRKLNRSLNTANVKITTANDALAETIQELKAAQSQLIQAEKMAFLGELTAGIAHEIQNPLNFVNNFSEVSIELLEELQEEAKAGKMNEVQQIGFDLADNLKKMHHHGKRADSIVKGMLEHSRASTGKKELTDMNKLADEFLRLSYHGFRAKDKNFKATLVTNFEGGLPLLNIIPQDIGRVLLNLLNNAFYAIQQRGKTAGQGYEPTVEVFTTIDGGFARLIIKDNGTGIPDAIKEKIMQPFFTTKPSGEGTGLGLSLSYDIIVKAHGGTITMNSINGQGSEFIIQLPIH